MKKFLNNAAFATALFAVMFAAATLVGFSAPVVAASVMTSSWIVLS